MKIFLVVLGAAAGLAAAQTVIDAAPAGLATTTATVTYVVFDPDCSCHKTKTATYCPATASAVQHSTYTWYETECGCHKTAVVPAPMPTGNNYTAPMQPATTTPAAPVTPPPAATIPVQPETYQGGAMRMVGSVGGVMAGLMAFAMM